MPSRALSAAKDDLEISLGCEVSWGVGWCRASAGALTV